MRNNFKVLYWKYWVIWWDLLILHRCNACYKSRPVRRFLTHFRRNPLKSQLVQEARRKRMGKQCFKMLKICSCQWWKTWLKHINKPRNLWIWKDHASTAWSDAAAAAAAAMVAPRTRPEGVRWLRCRWEAHALAGSTSRKDLYIIHPVQCKLKLPGSNYAIKLNQRKR